jgi:hypothetical protein
VCRAAERDEQGEAAEDLGEAGHASPFERDGLEGKGRSQLYLQRFAEIAGS